MRPLVVDLTEVFYAFRGPKYYGIVRVVVDLAREIKKLHPIVRFAIYSPGHDDFFEVFPEIDISAEGGINLNVPVEAGPAWLRETHYDRNFLKQFLMRVARGINRQINLRRWRKAAVTLPRIDLNGAALLSASRTKLMVALLLSLERRKVDYHFHPILYDMIPMHHFGGHHPKSYASKFASDNRTIINCATQIIAISEFTKTDIQALSAAGKLPPLPEIVAVPLVHEIRASGEAPEKQIPEEPYLLAVGALIGRKNIEIVFNAMLVLHERGLPVPRLILAGAANRHVTDYLDQDKYVAIRSRIEHSVSPNQTDLIRYYENALALVIASRIEGWGLPAGEALWLGTPVLCSTAPVFDEVCGDLGLRFDPDRPEELADHIARLMGDRAYRDELVRRIIAAKPGFRVWADVARDTLAAVGRSRAASEGTTSTDHASAASAA